MIPTDTVVNVSVKSFSDSPVLTGGGAVVSSGACPQTSGDVCLDVGNSFTVTIPAGQVSGSRTVLMTARDEGGTAEGVEGVGLDGSASVGGEAVFVYGHAIRVYDAADAKVIGLSLHEAATGEAGLSSVGEGVGKAVRVRATMAGSWQSVWESRYSRVVWVTPGSVSGSATLGSCSGSGQSRVCTGDFGRSAGEVSVRMGSDDSATVGDVTITTYDDTVTEDGESVVFWGRSNSQWVVAPAMLTINDGDRYVDLSVSPSTVAEPASGNTRNDMRLTARFGQMVGNVFVPSTSSTHSSSFYFAVVFSGPVGDAGGRSRQCR